MSSQRTSPRLSSSSSVPTTTTVPTIRTTSLASLAAPPRAPTPPPATTVDTEQKQNNNNNGTNNNTSSSTSFPFPDVSSFTAILQELKNDMASLKQQIKQKDIVDPSISSSSLTFSTRATPGAMSSINTSHPTIKHERKQHIQQTVTNANKDILGADKQQLRLLLQHISGNDSDEDDNDMNIKLDELNIINNNNSNNNNEENEHDHNEVTTNPHITHNNNAHIHNHNTHNMHTTLPSSSSTTTSKYNASLFPLKPDQSLPFDELITKAVELKNRRRKFTDIDSIFNLLDEQFQTLLGDTKLVSKDAFAFYQYMIFLLKLLVNYGIDASSYYHFTLFKKIQESKYDLVHNGAYEVQTMQELYMYFLPIGADRLKSRHTNIGLDKLKPAGYKQHTSNRRNNHHGGFNNNNNNRTNTYHNNNNNNHNGTPSCPLHPNGKHAAKDCNLLSAIKSSSTSTPSTR
jgi:hypothetical protein